MSLKAYKAAAIALLLLAIASVYLAFSASNQRVDLQGPSAIAVLPDGGVWLSVEDSLWRFDAQGRRLAVVPPQRHGVHGLIANLVVHPTGDLVASVRDDPHLYFLDPATAAPRKRLVPHWPEDLARHGDRAITYAFHEDGRLAIATGGGHAVALFDPGGRFLARTAPGTYEFSNGLWWAGDSLWTTDTNRFALVELDGRTLAPRSRIVLRGSVRLWKYLGMAAGPPAGAAGTRVGSVVRFSSGMIEGHVVEVLASGEQRAYPTAGALEPRDLKWRGNELLVVDGASYAVKRYSADRLPLPDFGEPSARTQLADSLLLRESLQQRYYAGVIAAIAFFAAGAFLAWRAQSVEATRRLAALGVDLSQLGSMRLAAAERLRIALALAWPLVACTASLALYRWLPLDRGWMGLSRLQTGLLGLAILALGTVLALLVSLRKLRSSATDARMDAFLNQPAVDALASSDVFWRMRDPGELPREVMLLNGSPGGRRLIVLTNQRLLVFVANLRDYRLEREYARRDVLRAQLPARGETTWHQRAAAWLGGGTWLRMELRDATRVEGLVTANRTAHRVAALLRGAAMEAPSAAQFERMTAAVPGLVPSERPAQLQALASFLLPGLGQWMQGRSGTALFMFLPWLVLALGVVLPLVWTIWGPRSAVSLNLVGNAALAYFALCIVSAFDAWRMRQRVR
jgi:hypothetical protein